MLLRSAKSGAKGKALTKIVMKPYWITVNGFGALVRSGANPMIVSYNVVKI
jgi:hypothetical protein